MGHRIPSSRIGTSPRFPRADARAASIGLRITFIRHGWPRLRRLPAPSTLFALAGLVAWLFLLRPTALGGPASYIIVSGTSMEPTLNNGDLAIVQRLNQYQVGHVVVFPVEGSYVIHRIVGVSENGFVLQGDNREDADRWKPGPEEILGRLWLKIPAGGRVLRVIRQPYVLGAIAAAIGASYVLSWDSKSKRKPRSEAKNAPLRPRLLRSVGAGKTRDGQWVIARHLVASGNGAAANSHKGVAPIFSSANPGTRLSVHQLLTWSQVDGRIKLDRPLPPGVAVNLVLKGTKSECRMVRGSMPRHEVIRGV